MSILRECRRGLLSAALAVALPAALLAQERGTVTGIVTDATTLAPLSGAQVVVEGSNYGALTNREGRYVIPNLPTGTHQLRSILIGYGPVVHEITIVAGETAFQNFQMTVSAITLDALVVTATGEQRKRELGNAVGTIEASEVVDVAPINSVSDLLQGRTAGVHVVSSTGTPGMGSRIRIRGASSISLSNEPLIYVDGIRVDNSNGLSQISVGGQEPSRFDDINPEDIESVEIVKGPAAATLYGTEAANGVIRITTKRGRAGETVWNAWVETGLVQEKNVYPLNYAGLDADGGGFAEFCLLDYEVSGLCRQDGVSSYQILMDPDETPFTTGLRQQYGLSVTGGSEQVNFYVSGEFEDEVGPYELPARDRELLVERGIPIGPEVEHPQHLKRVNLRANLNAQVADNATLAVRTGYLTSNLSLTGNDNNSFGFLPSAFFGGAFPDRPEEGWGFQAPAELFGRSLFQDVERVTASATATWNPIPWLALRATGGVDYTTRHDTDFFPRDLGVPDERNLGRRDSNFRSIYQYTFDAGGTATFDVTESIASSTALGVQFFRNLFTGTDAWGKDIVNGAGSIGAAAETFSDETTAEDKTAGLFIEQTFNVNDRLFLTGAIRADDNSAFGQDFDLIYYPKAAVSWVATEEAFFPSVPGLDELRFRAAWGRSGLQPGATAAIQTLSADAVTDPDDQTVSGVSIGEIGNNLLEPERSSEIEIGFDADLFGGRAGLELTYYDKNTEGALIEVPLAPSLGASNTQWVNIGEVENKGFEASLMASVVSTEDLHWDIVLSGSVNKNKLLSLGEGIEPIGNQTRHVPGYPLGGQWAEPILGYDDADGNGILTADELTIGDTIEFVGAGLPEDQLSVSTSVTLMERLRLYAMMDYRGGYVSYNNTERFRCRFRLCRALVDRSAPMWDQARAVAAVYEGTQTVSGYLEDASFLKFRELSLTFLVPEEWAQVFRSSRASVTVTGRNLATWTDYTGMDPEINSAGASDNFGTSEFLTQPPLRYWTLRFNFSF